MKKMLLLLLAIMLIVGCSKKSENEESNDVGCGTDETGCEVVAVTDEVKNYREYITNFKEISYEEVAKRIANGGSFIVFYGFETCPWCQQLIPYLSEYTKDVDIYYVNMKPDSEDSRVEGHPNYEAYLTNYEYINAYEETEKIYAPTLVEVINGEITNIHVATVEGHEKVDGVLPQMNDEQIEELKGILEDFFNQYTGAVK